MGGVLMQIKKPKISKRDILKTFIFLAFLLNILTVFLFIDILKMKLNNEKNYIKESQKSILNLYKKITQTEILSSIERDVDLLVAAYNFEGNSTSENFDRFLDTYIRTNRKYVGIEIVENNNKGIVKRPELNDEKIVKLTKNVYNSLGEPILVSMYYDLYEVINMFDEYEKLTSDTLYFLKSNGEDLNQKRNHPPFKEKYSDEWFQIESELSGNFETSSGIFSFITFPTLQSAKFEIEELQNWVLVIRYPNSKIRDLLNNLLFERLVAFKYAEPIIILISLTIAYLLARRKSLYNQLQNTAIYDSLTSVYNRNGGLNLLEETRRLLKRSKEPIALCCANVTGLRNINTRYGHEEGDQALVQVAGIFSNLIRESDAVVRMGGDEFLLIFPRCKGDEHLIIEKRLIKMVKTSNTESGKAYQINMKYGFAELSPYNMEPLNKIIKQVELNMTKEI